MTAVVIPAHDEAATIGRVLSATVGVDLTQVIVVADKCSDDTAQIAREAGFEVVETSAGDKGSAMAAGLSHVRDALTLFLDADLSGLRPEHVEGLATIGPLGGQVVGIRADAPATSLPPISGERRLPTEFLRRLPLAGAGYRVETLINAAVGNAGLPWKHVRMIGVTNPSRVTSAPLSWAGMWADLGVTGLTNAGGLIRYTARGLARS